MTRAGQQPALAVILGIAGIIGFGIGTWLGNVTRPTTPTAAVQPTPAIVVATPSAASSPSPSATPTESSPSTEAPAPQPQQVILTLEGDSHDVSDSFEVKPGWQIQWQIEGTSIAVAVTGEQNLGVLIDEEGPASGVTGIAQGGVFRLEIAANGPWSIRVIDGEEPAPTAS
jgi:cytoskeletal protein RodZ